MSERAPELQFGPERAPPLEPIISREDGRSIVTLRGDLDLAGTSAFVDALATIIGRDDATVVVDMTQVRTMDVAAVAKLVRGHEYLAAHGRSLVVRSPSETVRRLLEDCGVAELLDEGGGGPDVSRVDDDAVGERLAAVTAMLRQATLERRAAAVDREQAARLYRQAALDRAAAGVDDLTGALRRGSGFEALRQEIDRCRRSGDRLVIGFVDVDGLKRVNDTRGHQAGDDLLQTVVAQLRASLRSYDIIVRFGGDEFVYSLAAADMRTARERFEAVRSALAEHNDDSVSAGFAVLRRDDTLESLIARADADLYQRRRRTSA